MALPASNTTFTFNLSTHHHSYSPNPKPKKTHLKSHPLNTPKSKFHPLTTQHEHPLKLKFSPLSSIDVSKEDKPTSEEPNSTRSAEEEEEEEGKQQQQQVDPRRLEEKFAVLNTGVHECRSCGHRYDEAVGDPGYPIPPGLPFEKLPEDWRCPTCGAAKSFFESKSVEIAGFAQNQQFGLGGNALTSDQKALLIYGSLFFFFLLFLSGYFLQ